MEQALRTRLTGNGPVAAIAGARVHWGIRPQDGALPAIVLTLAGGALSQNMEGLDHYQSTRVQVDCYAATYAEAVTLRDAVIAALVPEGTAGGVTFLRGFVNNRFARGEDTPGGYVHRQMIDFTLWHD